MNTFRAGWVGRSASIAAVFAGCFMASFPGRAGADAVTAKSEKIECITPDGRLTPISFSAEVTTLAPARVTAPDAIRCNLPEGETTFIIPLPKGTSLDRFTVINENVAASGEFNIAVANSHLSAGSRDWVQVDGIVPFAHKRLFNLSMVGIEARYLKLSFRVDRASRATQAQAARDAVATKVAQVEPPAAGPSDD